MKVILCRRWQLDEECVALVKKGELPRHLLMGYDVVLDGGIPYQWIDSNLRALRPFLADPSAVVIDALPGVSLDGGLMKFFGLARARLLTLFHGAVNPGRLSWLRSPRVHATIRGLDVAACLSLKARDELRGYGATTARYLCWGSDLGFYRESREEGEWFLASGRTGRDFATAIRAARLAEVPLRVVVHRASDLPDVGPLPDCVQVVQTSGLQLAQDDLLRAYAIVIPTFGGFSLNGITAMNEALAVGKPVIMTQMDYISIRPEEHGFGLTVPVCDACAMADAMRFLWTNRRIAGEMTRRARALAESTVNYESYCHAFSETLQLAAESLDH